MENYPILYLELTLNSRRGRYALYRYAYAGWLVAYFTPFWLFWPWSDLPKFVFGLILQQFAVVFLATPILTASAIAYEKERGTLQLLFSAGLTPAEIVIGKLLGRVALIGHILLAGMPLLFFVWKLTGLNLGWLIVLLVQTAVAAAAVAAVSLLASVWARNTRNAVLMLYTFGALTLSLAWVVGGGLFGGFLGWLQPVVRLVDPRAVWEPFWSEAGAGETLAMLAAQTAAWFVFAAGCVVLAINRLHPVWLRQLEPVARPESRVWWAPRPPVGDRPVYWKDLYSSGLLTAGPIRVPTIVAVVIVFAFSLALNWWVAGEWVAATPGYFTSQKIWFFTQGILGTILSAVLAGAQSAGAITTERERQTWDLLLTTPMPTRQIIHEKRAARVRAAAPFFVAYVLPALGFAAAMGPLPIVLCILFAGIAPAATSFAAAAGLACSAQAKDSWASLLGTVALVAALSAVILLYDFMICFSVAQMICQAAGIASDTIHGLMFAVSAGLLAFVSFLGVSLSRTNITVRHIATTERMSKREAGDPERILRRRRRAAAERTD